MNVSQRLYEKALPIWESYYQHPFVHGIADGTLPVEKFQFYMIQDHKYLMQYAKVFALGLIKADQESDMRLFSGLITATLVFNMRTNLFSISKSRSLSSAPI